MAVQRPACLKHHSFTSLANCSPNATAPSSRCVWAIGKGSEGLGPIRSNRPLVQRPKKRQAPILVMCRGSVWVAIGFHINLRLSREPATPVVIANFVAQNRSDRPNLLQISSPNDRQLVPSRVCSAVVKTKTWLRDAAPFDSFLLYARSLCV